MNRRHSSYPREPWSFGCHLFVSPLKSGLGVWWDMFDDDFVTGPKLTTAKGQSYTLFHFKDSVTHP